MGLILADKEDMNSEKKDFIENLKKISTRNKRYIIVFNKNDITLKKDIDKVKMKMRKLELNSKVDEVIYGKIKPEDIIKMLNHIPKHISVRLEADNIDQIIKLMKSKTLIEKLIKQGNIFLYKGIEIEPRIIESKMDGDDLKEEIEAKRVRLFKGCFK